MRIIVFFDLPTETSTDRKNYRRFRTNLIKSGFMMIQESVYAKLSLNQSQTRQIIDEVRSYKPRKGLVQILTVTEKQFSKMEMLCGESNTDIVNSDERLIVL